MIVGADDIRPHKRLLRILIPGGCKGHAQKAPVQRFLPLYRGFALLYPAAEKVTPSWL